MAREESWGWAVGDVLGINNMGMSRLTALLLLAMAGTAAAQAPAAPSPPPGPEGALARELLALPDAATRAAWLDAHRPQLSAALGREVNAQAAVLQKAGRFDDALAAFASGGVIGEAADDVSVRVAALRGQGEIERLRGNVRQALPLLERAMAEAEKAGDPALMGSLGSPLGMCHVQLGELQEAYAIFENQRAAYEKAGDARGRGNAESNLGTALGTMGRNEEALEAFQRSRDLLDGAGYAPGVARADNNIGLTLRNLGNYAGALEALTRSLQAKEAANDRSALPSTLKNIGDVYALQGARLQAIDYFRRSHAIAAEIGLKPAMIEALYDEGRVLLELERPQEARDAEEKSLALAREIESAEAITWVSMALAEVHHAQGDRAGALEILQECLETAEKREELPLAVHARWQMAGLRLEEGSAADALPLAEAAADAARRSFLPEELWPSLLLAARAQVALGQPARAEPLLREAIDVIEDLRTQAVGSEADRSEFLVSRAAPYQDLVALLADAGRDWEALAVAERSKGRVLLEVMGANARTASVLGPQERDEERALESALLAANSELRSLSQKRGADAERVKALEAERARRRRAVEDFRTRAYAVHPELRALRGESRPLDRDDVRVLLADGHTVLLEYVLGERAGYVFALRAGTGGEPVLAVHRLAGTAADLAKQASRLRAQLAQRDLAFAAQAARLYSLLLAPAGVRLPRGGHVVLVPDGRLWELPFQALQAASGHYLIEDVAVSYAPSLTVLRDMRARRPAAGTRPETLLALGNPELGAGVRRRAPSALMGGTLEPLPETETQVREIGQLYGAALTEIRVGSAARESWFKAEAPRYRILHLATHGVLDDASPLYSQLVLAAPAAGDAEDGLLEAREILDLKLGADLAVLSACETGRGQAGAGEGLIGMAWAFFVAGCPATVASQWKVEAASTTRLMLALHRQLRAGHTAAEALRVAALEQLHRPSERHPFYWAGFVAIGDADSPAR